MIHVTRNPLPPTIGIYLAKARRLAKGRLPSTKPVSKAEAETAKAIAFYLKRAKAKAAASTRSASMANTNAKGATKARGFSFAVYKDRDLAKVLETLFNFKCAYCESDYAHVTPKDIEHYRPKSLYYWLASEWTNLFPSCPDCNRQRLHDIPGQTEEALLGKLDQFPLSNEAGRVRSHTGDVKAEEPYRLLLNPCVDQPENHLSYDNEGLIHSRPNGTGAPSAIGETSIEVYALQRKRLVEKRLVVLNQVKLQFAQLQHLVRMQNFLVTARGVPSDVLQSNLAEIERTIQELKKLFAPRSVFLGMLREYVRTAAANGEFADLLQFRIDPQQFLPAGAAA